MRIHTEEERHAAQETLKEVMEKLEEAMRLAQTREQEHVRKTAGAARG